MVADLKMTKTSMVDQDINKFQVVYLPLGSPKFTWRVLNTQNKYCAVGGVAAANGKLNWMAMQSLRQGFQSCLLSLDLSEEVLTETMISSLTKKWLPESFYAINGCLYSIYWLWLENRSMEIWTIKDWASMHYWVPVHALPIESILLSIGPPLQFTQIRVVGTSTDGNKLILHLRDEGKLVVYDLQSQKGSDICFRESDSGCLQMKEHAEICCHVHHSSLASWL
ncbi:hypothetical protein Ancab_037816 [Ancistrocladus abbreviatus]